MCFKKVSLVLLLVLNSICVCTGLFGCSSIYDDWQVVYIEGCGIIKIPNEWSYFNEDGVIYILDESSVPVMIQSYNYNCDMRKEESNKYYSNYKKIELVYNQVFSNSAVYEISKFLYEGKEIELSVIDLYVETVDCSDVILVVWNTDVEEKLIKDIAKSFIMEKFVDKNQK